MKKAYLLARKALNIKPVFPESANKNKTNYIKCACPTQIQPSHTQLKLYSTSLHKGVYPQSDGSLGIVDIDASKGFVDLWEHLALAIFANFDVK